MKRIREEAEVIVRLDYVDKKAHICVSAWPQMARKMAKLYGISRDGRNTSQGARWQVPLRCISFRKDSPRLSKGRPFPLQNNAKTGSPEKSG